MAFTLSAAQTISGVANSYVVTGSGNLSDLASACSGIGMSRYGNVIVFAPGVSRILAISGTLTEQRDGVWTVQVRSSGHICWAYDGASVVTLGYYDSTAGAYRSSVDIVYETSAMSLGAGQFSNAQGKCFVGAGTFYGLCGSALYSQPSRSDFDVWDGVTLMSVDNWTFSGAITSGVVYIPHMYKSSGKTVTTQNTSFMFTSNLEAGATVSSVTPFFVNSGFRWLSPAAGSILRVSKPTYSAIDAWSGDPTARIDVIDPSARYSGPTDTTGYAGVKRVLRTLKVNYTDTLGATITTPTPKLVTVTSAGAATVTNFSGVAASVEILQSTRASGVAHTSTGTGYTNEGNYHAYAVGFGYAACKTGINALTDNSGTAGIVLSMSSLKSSLVTTAYASVVTAPFLHSTATNTLTISENATIEQAAEYLFKLAYDNADNAYWIARLHTPATVTSGKPDFGTLNFVVAAGVTLTGDFITTGTVTNNGSIAGVYTSGSGTSVAITVSVNKSGCRMRLADNSGTEKYNAVLSGSSVTIYYPVGATGSWTGAVELYGYGRQAFTVNVTGGGAFSTSAVMVADSTVSDTLTNVSAYTALDTSQKIRDWIAYYNQTATGIANPLTAVLTASSLSIGSTTLTKGGTLGYASGVLTTGGTTLSGVNIVTTGTQTAANLPTLTYPQQVTDSTGTTNWLTVTMASGQVAQDSYNNAFKTASYTTFLPASYTSTTTLYISARGYKKQVLSIPYSTSLLAAQAVTLIPDSSVSDTTTDFLTTATALTTEQQMYDAYSQWQATSTGILDTYLPTKSPNALDFGSVAATFDPSATATVTRGSGTITFKTGTVASGTYYSTGAITVSSATLGDSVKIRGANLNSEIVLDSIDSLRVYPTSNDRDSNTNLAFTVSTTVYRFKYGATVSGATLSGTLYTRPSSNGEQSLKDYTLASGNTVFSLSQLGMIQATLAKVNSLPTRDNNQADLAATENRIVASM